jgi:alkylated DNA repair dioxygenase AlkB
VCNVVDIRSNRVYGRTVSVLQGSLLDLADEVIVHPLGAVRRSQLDDTAWVDLRPGWIGGADELYAALRRDVPWHAERRQMYDSVVDVPRLQCFYGAEDPLPHPALAECRDALSRYYDSELGEPFVTAGLCLYRDGQDSVAWHGDRIGRSRDQDTMVAIVSVGAPRDLVLRPRGGGLLGAPGCRPRGPARHGWLVPAHLGPLRPQDHQGRRAAHLGAVPGRRRALNCADDPE